MFTGSCLANSFLAEMWQAVHNFSSNGDVFNLALYDNTSSLNNLITAYTPGMTGEISAAGYVPGGAAVPTSLGVGSGGAVTFPQFLPVSWPTQLTAHGGLIYNLTKGLRAVCVIDFGFSITASPFTVTFPSNGPSSAFLRLIGSPGAY